MEMLQNYWEKVAKFLATELEKRKIIETVTYKKEFLANDWISIAINKESSIKQKTIDKESSYNSVPWTETPPVVPGVYRVETPKGDIKLACVYPGGKGRLSFYFQGSDAGSSCFVITSSHLVKRWAGPYGNEFEDVKDIL